MKSRDTLTKRIFLSNIAVVIIIMVLTIGILFLVGRKSMEEEIDLKIIEVATILSEDPSVKASFDRGYVDDEAMEFLDSAVRKDDSIDYIVLARPDSVRLYHPDHSLIGERFQGGDEGPAAEGSELYITEGTGTTERQRRCFISMNNDDGDVTGFIMVSRRTAEIRGILLAQTSQLIILALAAIILSIVISYALSSSIRKDLLGYEPSEIARMFLQREEVLDGLDEGIMLISDSGTCEYANDAARRVFSDKGEEGIQRFIDEYIKESVISKESVLQETIRIDDKTLLVDILPVWNESRYAGCLVEIGDKSESIRLAAQLTGVDQIIGALRASTHETKNRMHVILGLLQIGEVDEAIEFIQSAAAYDEEADHIRGLIHNNTLAALIIGKRNRANELGIDLTVRKDSRLGEKSSFLTSAELVTIVGNLIENAFDAIAENESGPREISLYIFENEEMLIISSDDTGCGMTEEQVSKLYAGGYTSKGEGHGIGMGLIRNILRGSNGTMDIESEPGEGTSISITVRRSEV